MYSFVSVIVAGIVILLSAIPLARRFVRWLRFSRAIDKIPGPLKLPIIGTAWKFIGLPREQFFNTIKKYNVQFPVIYRLWYGSNAEVHLTKAEHVGLFKSSATHLEKSYVYNFLRPWLGDGLLISHHGKWHKHRKIITPTFHFSILDDFCEVFAEQSEILTGILEQHADTGIAFDVCPYVTLAALDIICETAMGTKVNVQSDSEKQYVKALYEITEKSFTRMFTPWVSSDFLYALTENGKIFNKCWNTLHIFTMNVIAERMKTRKLAGAESVANDSADSDIGKKKRQAFLDVLIDAYERDHTFTMEDIREEVDTFMFAGHDTTASGISWTLFCLGHNESVQTKLAEEIDAVFDNSDEPVTIRKLNELKYLERVVKESMRLYPPVPVIGSKTSEPVEVAGFTIPKNSHVHFHIHAVQRDPDHFPDPEKFDPDRFLPENCVNRHPYAYIPFSAGPRNCIGQKFAILEEKTVIAAIIRKFKIKSAEQPEDIFQISELILRSKSGINLFLEKRN